MSGISWRIIAPVVILAVVVGAGTIFLVTTEGGRDLLLQKLASNLISLHVLIHGWTLSMIRQE